MKMVERFAFPHRLSEKQAEIDEMIAQLKAQWLRPIQS
jgi:hypothetical protein